MAKAKDKLFVVDGAIVEYRDLYADEIVHEYQLVRSGKVVEPPIVIDWKKK